MKSEMASERDWAHLFNRRRFGIKLGLENEEALLAAMGNPHARYPVIHVAGTNGKGSTCALITSILSAAGLRVGLFTSPHLARFNERYRIGDDDIDDAALKALVAEVEAHAEAVEQQTCTPVTFFECSAAIAFKYFADKGVDVAVIEVGLGGRYDATNVVHPAVSVITRISLEHTEYLGDTLVEIAGEKAGIVKPGVPVVCGSSDPEALDTIRRIAGERSAPVVNVPDAVSVLCRKTSLSGQNVSVESADAGYGAMRLPLLGEHQMENLATAVAAVETFAGRLGVGLEPDIVKKGVAAVAWPGRLTVAGDDPPVLIDGAHNPQGGQALRKALKAIAGRRPVGLVIGMCRDKDAPAFARELAPAATRAWAVPVDNERTFTPEALHDVLAAAGMASEERGTLAEGVGAAVEWARESDGIVCIAGSLFLAGEALELMGER